jgi:hypothetical protein
MRCSALSAHTPVLIFIPVGVVEEAREKISAGEGHIFLTLSAAMDYIPTRPVRNSTSFGTLIKNKCF